MRPPYVLVGHSRGGLFARHFVRQFRDDVAGVVLADSSHPDTMLRYRQPDGSFRWQRVRDRAGDRPVPEPTTAPVDTNRETRSMEITRDTSAVTAGMPARMAALVHDRCNRTAMLPTDLRSCFAEELQEMVDRPELYDLRDLPLRVVIGALRLVKAPRLP